VHDVHDVACVRFAVCSLVPGCYEVSLCDTTGKGGMLDWAALLERVTKDCPPEQLAIHIHNTCGQAMACILFAMYVSASGLPREFESLGPRVGANRCRCVVLLLSWP
jgi:hydroxymethylglutaryl-CoA lyase